MFRKKTTGMNNAIIIIIIIHKPVKCGKRDQAVGAKGLGPEVENR